MAKWEIAVMMMICISSVGFLLSDGEQKRVQWIRAMRRCLLRFSALIRYERPPLAQLLMRADLKGTPQERALSRLLFLCGEKLASGGNPQTELIFAKESAKMPGYGVLGEEDRQSFETVIAELGIHRMEEQMQMLERADERLKEREQVLSRECTRRAQLIRTLGVACGAAVFLILI